MSKKNGRNSYLNTSFALCVLGLGMVLIGGFAMREPGAIQLLIIGAGVATYGAVRVHTWNRNHNPKDE